MRKKLKLADLRQVYILYLEKTEHINLNYQNEKLKTKLEGHDPFKRKLLFCDMGIFQTCIVYSSAIDVHTAVKLAFQLGTTDVIKKPGLHLQETILNEYSVI